MESMRGLIQGFAEMTASLEESLEKTEAAGMKNDELLTVQETAEFLKSTRAYVYARIRRKTNPLPSFQDGVTRIRRAALVEWVKQNEKSYRSRTRNPHRRARS